MLDVSPLRLIAGFGDALLATDLPALSADRRAQTVAFTVGRIDRLPSPMRLGVGFVAVFVGVLGSIVGVERLAGLLARRPLPVLGDYVRLIRSLSFAYVWDRWPSTAANGAAR